MSPKDLVIRSLPTSAQLHRRRRSRTIAAIAISVCLSGAVVACSSNTSSTAETDTASDSAADVQDTTAEATEPTDGDASGAAGTTTPSAKGTDALSDDDVLTTLDGISEFWSGQASALGIKAYEKVPRERLQPLGGDPVACDGQPVADADVEDNAVALACEEGYAVLWDPAMVKNLSGKYGSAAALEVLAHEWGHIIEYQLNLDLQGVIAEQFADCLAGVWAADASSKKLPPYESKQALDGTVAAVAEFRDEPGDSADDDEAHGSAFDRVRAFQEGFDRGAKFCVSYKDTPPSLTEVPYSDKTEKANGGNLSFEETIDSDTKNLGSFMTQNPNPFPPVEIDFRSLSKADAADLHEQIGDAATSVILAADAAAEAQRTAGEDSTSEGALLQQACWTGSYFGWIWAGNSAETELSPGDLDEAIAAFVALTDESAAGFVFEQVSQMRTGFVQGVSACTNPE